MVPLKPLLKSRVAWGRTMWDWPRMEARLYNSFVVVEFKIVPFPFVITVFSWLIKGGFMMRKWPLTLYIVHSNTNKQSLELILTLCQTKTLCITAPPQNTIPRPMTTEVTMAGVSLKCRKVKRTIPGKIFRQKSFWNKRFINKNLDWFGMRCTKKNIMQSQFPVHYKEWRDDRNCAVFAKSSKLQHSIFGQQSLICKVHKAILWWLWDFKSFGCI